MESISDVPVNHVEESVVPTKGTGTAKEDGKPTEKSAAGFGGPSPTKQAGAKEDGKLTENAAAGFGGPSPTKQATAKEDEKPTEKAAAGSPKSGFFLPDIEDLMTTRGCDGCPLKSRCGIGKGKTAKKAVKEE